MAKHEHEDPAPELSLDDINEALTALLARGFVEILPEDLASGANPPRWRLTEAGRLFAEQIQ